MNSVPKTARQSKHEMYSEQAGIKRLDKHGDLILIDSLVKQYPAYTHDDVFDLEYGFVMALLFMNKESAYIRDTTADMRRKLESPNK